MYSVSHERNPDTPFIFTNGRERKYNMAETVAKEKTAKGLFWGAIQQWHPAIPEPAVRNYHTRMLDSTSYGSDCMLAIFTAVAPTLVQKSGFTATLGQ